MKFTERQQEMTKPHLALQLMYPLPDDWQNDDELVISLKDIFPKSVEKNRALIDQAITDAVEIERQACIRIADEVGGIDGARIVSLIGERYSQKPEPQS